MLNIKGKWALVTGASRGIGRLSALFLAERGCHLILHARELSHLSEIDTAVRAFGVETRLVAADLAKSEEVTAMLTALDEMNLDIELLLNNAGYQIAYRSDYFATPENDYVQSFLINTIAPMRLCYHLIPKMVERGFGRVVNTTSGIALEPEQAGYSASKVALDKVTIDLGSKLNGTNVMLNLVDPGWCRTDMGGQFAPNAPESALPGVLVGIFAEDKKSGRIFSAQEFSGLSIESAVEKAESIL